MNQEVVCFDLDDTLYKEIDYLISAFREIAEVVGHSEAIGQMMDWYYGKKNVFANLIGTYGLSISVDDCLKMYRNHYPDISLDEGVRFFLDLLKDNGVKIGLISDGRSITQRNKIKALGLEGFFDIVIISEEFGTEKPDLRNYQAVMDAFPERKCFVYVGDNPQKDFIAPNQLGWMTVCLLDDGNNIHQQDFKCEKKKLPKVSISNIAKLIDII